MGDSAALKLLVVEDQPEHARLVQAYLASSSDPSLHVLHADTLAVAMRHLGVAGIGLILLDLLVQLPAGASAYTAFLNLWRTPPMWYLNLVLFALVLWHAISWFMLIGKAQPIQFTRRPLPWKVVFGVNVLLWLGVSGAVVYLIFGGI